MMFHIANWTSFVITMKGRELVNEVGIRAFPFTLSSGIMKFKGQENEIQGQIKTLEMRNVLLSLTAN